MKYEIEALKANKIFDEISELEKLLTERIEDLHEVKGGMQARHAYVLYRDKLIQVQHKLAEGLKSGEKHPKEEITYKTFP